MSTWIFIQKYSKLESCGIPKYGGPVLLIVLRDPLKPTYLSISCFQITSCSTSRWLEANIFPQNLHLWSDSPVWINICCRSAVFCAKACPHVVQMWFLIFLWTAFWFGFLNLWKYNQATLWGMQHCEKQRSKIFWAPEYYRWNG